MISVSGEHSNLLECRRKTELIGVLLKHNPSIRIQFTDTCAHPFSPLARAAQVLCNASLHSFNVALKGGKTCVVKFIRDPLAGDGKIKGTKVSVAPGMPSSSGGLSSPSSPSPSHA